LSEIRVKSTKPLPEPLPEGERVLWQQSPAWRSYARRVFQIGKIALYFLIVVAWVATAAYLDQGGWTAVARSLAWSLPPALGVLGLLGLIAWLYARTSVFTITNRRVVIQSGLALPSAVNLPFSKVSSADLRTFGDGTGDIDLSMSGPRLLYSMVWPNVRWLRLRRPIPVLRAVEHPRQVAQILGDALAADQATEAPPSASQDAEAQPGTRQAVTS
jgi:hypothetical protein